MNQFSAVLDKIGINPFVFIPDEILLDIISTHGKEKGPIPVKGTINGVEYQQTLVRYQGDWRLYINMIILPNSPKRIGETIEVTIDYDTSDRSIEPHPKLIDALKNNPLAQEKFDALTPYLKREIVRYISSLKSASSIDKNVSRAIDFLLGKGAFIGREPLV